MRHATRGTASARAVGMLGRNASMLVLSFAGVLALGACNRDRGRDRREATPGEETRTHSGEMPREAPRVEPQRSESEPPPLAAPVVEPRAPEAAASDPRFDAGRLSIIGSAEELRRNLGLPEQGADAAAAAPMAPAPQVGAGVIENPPPPTYREGAGRPGAGGDPYQ